MIVWLTKQCKSLKTRQGRLLTSWRGFNVGAAMHYDALGYVSVIWPGLMVVIVTCVTALTAWGQGTQPATSSTAAKPCLLIFHVDRAHQHEILRFSKTGQPQESTCYLELWLVARYKGSLPVRSYQILGVDKLMTGSGRGLYVKPYDQPYGPQIERLDDGNVDFRVKAASSGMVRSIRLIQGKVKLRLATVRPWIATLSPIHKYLGQKIWIPKLGPKAWVKIMRGQDSSDHEIHIAWSKPLFDKLKSVAFTTNDGRLLQTEPDPIDYGDVDYTVKLPDTGKVVMAYWPKLKSVVVPFTVKNIDLPLSPQHRSPQTPQEQQPHGELTITTTQTSQGHEHSGGGEPTGPVLHNEHGELRGTSQNKPPAAPR